MLVRMNVVMEASVSSRQYSTYSSKHISKNICNNHYTIWSKCSVFDCQLWRMNKKSTFSEFSLDELHEWGRITLTDRISVVMIFGGEKLPSKNWN